MDILRLEACKLVRDKFDTVSDSIRQFAETLIIDIEHKCQEDTYDDEYFKTLPDRFAINAEVNKYKNDVCIAILSGVNKNSTVTFIVALLNLTIEHCNPQIIKDLFNPPRYSATYLN